MIPQRGSGRKQLDGYLLLALHLAPLASAYLRREAMQMPARISAPPVAVDPALPFLIDGSNYTKFSRLGKE